jgi:inosose dehydratase
VTDPAGVRRLVLGSCPDSWGVWFADDPRQTPWTRFLDDLATAGYHWLELGPYGYLPTDPHQLQDELDRRELYAAGGTMHGYSGLHRPEDVPAIVAQTRKVAELSAAVGARHLIFVPVPGYRDDTTGAYLAPPELDAEQWKRMIGTVDDLGRMTAEEFGITLQFHPHADYHVETQAQTERFLDDTDPRYVSLCLDTGHLAYRRADIPALIRGYPERIGYVHIKQMDPAIVERAERENLAFGEAVAHGASCEPPLGLPDIPSVVTALRELDAELFVVVEQDMYPVTFDVPLPIATRTREYLNSCGLQSVAPVAADRSAGSPSPTLGNPEGRNP